MDIFAKFNVLAQEVTGKTAEERLKEAEEAEIRGHKFALPALKTVKKEKSEEEAKQQTDFAWGESLRGVPNSVLRSALFTATKRGKRKSMFREKLVAQSGINILFSGLRLDQADLDVWQQTLHISRATKFGVKVKFTGGSFLKAIGRNTSGASHEWLKDSLTRLMISAVELSDGKKTFSGQLIHNWYLDEVDKKCVVELNPQLMNLFAHDSWTAIEWEQRKQLKGKPLAQWLHGFYSSHAHPFDMKVETLHGLCGSETKDMYAFKQMLKEALNDLATVTGWFCRIENNKVQIFKDHSHLLAKLKK